MKKWIALALAVAILAGVGALLLSTRQAPLLAESEQAPSPGANGEPDATAPMATQVGQVDSGDSAHHAGDGHDHGAGSQQPAMPSGVDPLAGKRLSTEEFRTMTAKVAKDLPTKKSVQGISEKDAHTLPAPMVEAGRQLGLIAQAVANEPSLANDAYLFYEKCAGSDQYLDAVRALCFSNYKGYGSKLGLAVRNEVAPAKIRELAERLEVK